MPLFASPLWVLLSLLCCQLFSADNTINAEPGHPIALPCRAADSRTIVVVEWSRADLKDKFVLLYRNGGIDPQNQHPLFKERVDLLNSQLKDGDASLLLKTPMTNDSGTYECRVAQTGTVKKLISNIILVVAPPEPFPSWATAVLVLLALVVLVLIVAAGLFYCLRHYFRSVYKVEVEPGVESVLLPCKILPWRIREDAKVEWRDNRGRKVHVYQNGSDLPGTEGQLYRNRTMMNKIPLRTGNLSLTLRQPTVGDSGIYTCSVYNRKRDILTKKDIHLVVKVPQVEVESGAESVLLPCKTTAQLPGDARVAWMDDDDDVVHLYQNGSDQLGEQDQFYRTRTRMEKDLLRTGDVSLTLSWPTEGDSRIYTCSVSTVDGDILMMKQVQLKVKVPQVEAEQGEESVLLPFTTTPGLPEDAKMEWMDNKGRKVYVYQNCSDQPQKQHQLYRDRARMDADALITGHLSLTLMQPRVRDSGKYKCVVWNDEEDLRRAKVQLTVKGVFLSPRQNLSLARTVQVQPKDIQTNSGSVDPTPLMADQSV